MARRARHPLFHTDTKASVFVLQYSNCIFSGKRIFCRIHHSLRLIEVNFIHFHTDIFKYFIQCFSEMSESNSAMVRIIFLNQYVTIETSHFRNCEYADSAKGTGCNRKNLTLCDISAQLGIRCALQTVEGDISGDNI